MPLDRAGGVSRGEADAAGALDLLSLVSLERDASRVKGFAGALVEEARECCAARERGRLCFDVLERRLLRLVLWEDEEEEVEEEVGERACLRRFLLFGSRGPPHHGLKKGDA